MVQWPLDDRSTKHHNIEIDLHEVHYDQIIQYNLPTRCEKTAHGQRRQNSPRTVSNILLREIMKFAVRINNRGNKM